MLIILLIVDVLVVAAQAQTNLIYEIKLVKRFPPSQLGDILVNDIHSIAQTLAHHSAIQNSHLI
jgi:hypothetical protein